MPRWLNTALHTALPFVTMPANQNLPVQACLCIAVFPCMPSIHLYSSLQWLFFVFILLTESIPRLTPKHVRSLRGNALSRFSMQKWAPMAQRYVKRCTLYYLLAYTYIRSYTAWSAAKLNTHFGIQLPCEDFPRVTPKHARRVCGNALTRFSMHNHA